jgi:hypothetical protein
MVNVNNVRRGHIFTFGEHRYIRISDIDAQNLCRYYEKKLVYPKDAYCTFSLPLNDDRPRLAFWNIKDLTTVIDEGHVRDTRFIVKSWIHHAIYNLNLLEENGTPQGPIGAKGESGPVGCSGAEYGSNAYTPMGCTGAPGTTGHPGPEPEDTDIKKCPIDNVELWNITPPLQRKAILKLQLKRIMNEIDEQIKKNQTINLAKLENELKKDGSWENLMGYNGLVGRSYHKKENKKEFIPKKEVQEENTTYEVYRPTFKLNKSVYNYFYDKETLDKIYNNYKVRPVL